MSDLPVYNVQVARGVMILWHSIQLPGYEACRLYKQRSIRRHLGLDARQYLHRRVAPLALTFVFDHKDPSARWKEIVEPLPGHFTHPLELISLDEIDTEVERWLMEAWKNAN